MLKQLDMGSVGGYKQLVQVGVDGGDQINNGAFATKKGSNQKKSTDKEEKGIKHPQSSNNAKHRWTEKQRRRKMNNMFQELQALLPKEHHKVPIYIIPQCVCFPTSLSCGDHN